MKLCKANVLIRSQRIYGFDWCFECLSRSANLIFSLFSYEQTRCNTFYGNAMQTHCIRENVHRIFIYFYRLFLSLATAASPLKITALKMRIKQMNDTFGYAAH